jgi:hypothetical protein
MNLPLVTACQALGLPPDLVKSDIIQMTLTNIDRELALHLVRTFPYLHDKIDPSFFDDIEIALEYILSYVKYIDQYTVSKAPFICSLIDKYPDLLFSIYRSPSEHLIQDLPNSVINHGYKNIHLNLQTADYLFRFKIRLNRDQILILLKRGIYDSELMDEHVKDDRELSGILN